jgi:hypothetical protein
MGGGDYASEQAIRNAYRLGELIAEQGWVLLNGGRNVGVMAASAAGARSKGGLTIGVLPDSSTRFAAPDLDIAIVTGMGDARNMINVLSSDVIISCAGGPGTLSEIALALKNGRTVILVNFDIGPVFMEYAGERLLRAVTPEEAIDLARRALSQQ